ncbi:MAG: hypothetical protein K0R02_714 [Rickettsiaceae bacterium]|jgi:hypothetical protein|nr:hypothetical protein [Rickettsiaceae bacterium]
MIIKYIVGKIMGIRRPVSGATPKKKIIAETHMDAAIYLPQYLGKFELRSLPRLLKYLSSSNFTGLKELINLGIYKYPVTATKKLITIPKKRGRSMFLKIMHETFSINQAKATVDILATMFNKFHLLSYVKRCSFILFTSFIALIPGLIIGYIIAFFREKHKRLLILLSISLNLVVINYAAASDYKDLIRKKEQEYGIPKDLLLSIATVESKLHPFAINVQGRPYFFKTFEEAINATTLIRNKGIKNFDVGLMQINYKYHHENFENIKQMLSPEMNIEYAAKLLCKLYGEYNSWSHAIRLYHSANEQYNKVYAKRIAIAWLKTNK